MKKLLGFLIGALALTVGLYAVDSSGDPLELPPIKNTQHLEKLKAAFDADEYYIDSYIEYPSGSGKFGIRAASKYALNYETGSPKLAFYLEGKPADIGYQMGYLAEAEIALMTTIFVKLIPADFIDPQLPLKIRVKIGKIIDKLMLPGVRKLAESEAIPGEYKDQITGILKGCQDANSNTRVTKDGLELLNYGMDVLFSIVYEGSLPQREGILPHQLRIPLPGS